MSVDGYKTSTTTARGFSSRVSCNYVDAALHVNDARRHLAALVGRQPGSCLGKEDSNELCAYSTMATGHTKPYFDF